MRPAPRPAAQAKIAQAGKQDLTTGNIPRHLFNLAFPSALSNLLTFSTMLIDMIWLGRVSPTAIAAITTYNYIWFMFSLLNQAIGNGSVALIARTYGAGELDDCKRVFGQTFSFKVLVALIVTAIGLCCQRTFYIWFGARGEVLEQTVRYGTVMFAATPLLFSTFTLKTGLRAIGDMKTLLKISAATAVINLIVDPLLIFENIKLGPVSWLGISREIHITDGLGLGVAGAAWGTVIAFAIVFTSTLFIYFSGRTFIRPQLWHFTSLSWPTAWRILRIGVPPALSDSLQHVANLFVGSAINTYGTTVFAGQGVNQMLVRLTRMTTMGITMGGITMVGQNLGAGKPRRAERSVYAGLAITAALMAVVAVLLYFFAPQLAKLFIPGTDPDSLETATWAARILRINTVVLFIFGLSRIVRAPFQGSGDTKPPLWSTLVAHYGLQLPIVLIGVYVLEIPEPYFIWWAEALAFLAAGIFLFTVFRRGHWKTYKV